MVELSKRLLNEIVNRILKVVKPSKIILFGSYAYGKPHKGSDLDILVVIDETLSSRRELRIKIRRMLRDFLVSKDIVVVTNKDLKEWENISQAFITSIMKKGKTIYERRD